MNDDDVVFRLLNAYSKAFAAEMEKLGLDLNHRFMHGDYCTVSGCAFDGGRGGASLAEIKVSPKHFSCLKGSISEAPTPGCFLDGVQVRSDPHMPNDIAVILNSAGGVLSIIKLEEPT